MRVPEKLLLPWPTCLISWKLPTLERSIFVFPCGLDKTQRELKARNILISFSTLSLRDSHLIHKLRANARGRGKKSQRVCSSDILIRAQRWEGGTSPKLPFWRHTFAVLLRKRSSPPFSRLGRLTRGFKSHQTHRNIFVWCLYKCLYNLIYSYILL